MNERKEIGRVTLSVKLKRALWNVVSAVLFRPLGTKVFRLWRVALLRAFGADVAWGAEVYASAKVWAPWNLTMKKGACLGPHTICYNQAMVTIGQDACVSQMATLCTAGHKVNGNNNDNVNDNVNLNNHSPLPNNQTINNARTGLIVADITLCDGAWVGMQAFVGMGVTVGEKAIVGARANVFKDVPENSVVYAAVGNCAGL